MGTAHEVPISFSGFLLLLLVLVLAACVPAFPVFLAQPCAFNYVKAKRKRENSRIF